MAESLTLWRCPDAAQDMGIAAFRLNHGRCDSCDAVCEPVEYVPVDSLERFRASYVREGAEHDVTKQRVVELEATELKWIAENTRLRQGLVDVHSKIEEMHRRGGHTWNEVLDIAAHARLALKGDGAK